jgi:hypothetical protein
MHLQPLTAEQYDAAVAADPRRCLPMPPAWWEGKRPGVP